MSVISYHDLRVNHFKKNLKIIMYSLLTDCYINYRKLASFGFNYVLVLSGRFVQRILSRIFISGLQ